MLLVIAADDGVMPQTRERVAIVDLLGIERGVVVLTKVDLAAPPQQAKVVADIGQLLQGTSLEGAEVVAVSTATGEGIDELREKLFDAGRTIRPRATAERFRLAVDLFHARRFRSSRGWSAGLPRRWNCGASRVFAIAGVRRIDACTRYNA
jgi:selenocysteine-specific elongation factor